MFNFKVKSLATKLILVTGCAITTVLVASNSFLISQTSDRVHALTMDQANTEARAIANVIAADVGELGSAARSMAGVIGRAHQAKSMDRPGIVNILKANVEQNAFAFGSWFCEQLGLFDGQSTEIADRLDLGTNKNGVFAPIGRRPRRVTSSSLLSIMTTPLNGGRSPPRRARAPSPSHIWRRVRKCPPP